jgi:hypothetical protein
MRKAYTMGSILERIKGRQEQRSGTVVHYEDPDAHETYPALAEILYKSRVGKEKRKAGAVRIFVDGGALKVAVTCPTEGVVAFVTLTSLSSILDDLERLLMDDKVEWRQDTYGKRRGA